MQFRLSPSALDRYRSCPRQFLHADIERRPRAEFSRARAATGGAIHHALERFYGLPDSERIEANLERALRAVWPDHRSSSTFASREEEAAMGRAALAMLRLYGERFDLYAHPLAREQWVGTTLENGVRLYGKVDRIDPINLTAVGTETEPTADGDVAREARLIAVSARADRGGTSQAHIEPVHNGVAGNPMGRALEVIDYKTGRPRNADLSDDSAAQVYVLAASDEIGIPVERVRFIYLPDGLEAIWELDAEDIQGLRARVTQLTSEIIGCEDFQATPGSHCRWCPFALQCLERQQVRVEELVPVENLPF